MEDPSKDSMEKDDNTREGLNRLAYGPSVACGFNTELIHKYKNIGTLRHAISLLKDLEDHHV